jgi:hypothetical protein
MQSASEREGTSANAANGGPLDIERCIVRYFARKDGLLMLETEFDASHQDRPEFVAARSTYSPELIAHFWGQVDRGDGPDSCWTWQGPIHRQGHGTFPVPGIWSSPPAHRIAYHLEFGVPPQGHVIWRDCSNPLCVNPRHLRAGDRGTFRRSMTSRGPRE